jgi:methanogenic corrinoid protein MtbC1
MYRRYSLDEIKRKIIYLLQINDAGLSGKELADKVGINRMTMTKYLDVLSTLRLIKKRKIGPVNVWFLEKGVTDLEFPIDFLEIQQKFLNAVMIRDENQSQKIILSVINSNADLIKILTDVILPTANTINELYNRGRLGKTERIYLLNSILELIDLIKFSIRSTEIKHNAYAVSVAGSEDRIYYAKTGTVALQLLGWESLYIGNVEQHIDPFFDIDLQRYLARVWDNKKGLMMICIYSSDESSLRFLTTATKSIKSKLKGDINIVLLSTDKLQMISDTVGVDYVAKDMQSLIDWTQQEYKKLKW